MSKERLLLDFDNCIVQSSKAYVDTYNYLYQNHPDFKLSDWTKSSKWDFSDICPLASNPEEIFAHPYFFKVLEFYDRDMKEVLKELTSKYQIIIVSIGTARNVALKSLWIDDNLPFIDDVILIKNKGCKMNKSLIDMSKGYFFDDVLSNLESSNARFKFVFGEEYEWNIESEYPRVRSSLDMLRVLL